MGTNIRRNDFWDRLGGQTLLNYDWLMAALHTIHQS